MNDLEAVDIGDNEESQAIASALNDANIYATKKTVTAETLNIAIVTTYINTLYMIISKFHGSYTPGHIIIIVCITLALMLQFVSLVFGLILMRRKRNIVGKTCKLSSISLNDGVMVMSFFTTILNLVIQRFSI